MTCGNLVPYPTNEQACRPSDWLSRGKFEEMKSVDRVEQTLSALTIDGVREEELVLHVVDAALEANLDWHETLMLCRRLEEKTGMVLLNLLNRIKS